MAPIPGVDGFLDYLRANLTVPITVLELSSVLDLGATPALLDPVRQFQCLRVIGAALRDEPGATEGLNPSSESAKPTEGLNLTAGNAEPSSESAKP